MTNFQNTFTFTLNSYIYYYTTTTTLWLSGFCLGLPG